MKNILITGGAGFIGTKLCEKLYNLGYTITILDNLSPQVHPKEIKQYPKKIWEKCIFIEGDVCDKDIWKRAFKDQDLLIHLAAETGTGQSMYELSKYNNVNIMGTANMLEYLATGDHNLKKIIVASSRAIYGEGKYKCSAHGYTYPLDRVERCIRNGDFNLKCKVCNTELQLVGTDEKSQINPLSIYAITKHQQEQMVMLMGKTLEIPAVSLRYQNVFGPGQSLSNPYTGILSIFSTRLLNGNDLEIYEDGLESRDFIFIEDVVDATILCLENSAADNQIFNVGSGKNTSVYKVAESLRELLNPKCQIRITGNYRLGDIRHNYADLSKIKDTLGFVPKYSFEQGISKFVSWVKNQRIEKDNYEKSVKELRIKGLLK